MSLERGEGVMKPNIRLLLGWVVFTGAFVSASFAGGQQAQPPIPQRNESYSLNRETLLEGVVISYTAASTAPPVGAHVTIQTASGPVDVHLGNAGLLKQGDIFLSAGDSIRIVGEKVAYADGSFFAARVLQKGSQSVTLRNTNGIPLSPGRSRATPGAPARRQGGLR